MSHFLSLFFYILFNVLAWSIFLRAILSWIPNIHGHPLALFLVQITDPILSPLRRIIPPIAGVLDITPMIAFIVLMLAAEYARRLG